MKVARRGRAAPGSSYPFPSFTGSTVPDFTLSNQGNILFPRKVLLVLEGFLEDFILTIFIDPVATTFYSMQILLTSLQQLSLLSSQAQKSLPCARTEASALTAAPPISATAPLDSKAVHARTRWTPVSPGPASMGLPVWPNPMVISARWEGLEEAGGRQSWAGYGKQQSWGRKGREKAFSFTPYVQPTTKSSCFPS